MSWEEEIKRFHAFRDRQEISVLLFGPGKNVYSYQKRKEIQDYILKKFPKGNVDIRMSEDMKNITSGPSRNEIEEEIEQCLIADLVIALDTSQGVGEEIARFGSNHKIAPKMFILTPDKYRGSKSMPSVFRSKLHCYYFSDNDYENSNLTKVCEDRIKVAINDIILNNKY